MRSLYFFAAAAVLVAWFVPQAQRQVLRPIEEFGARLAKRKRLSICLVAAAAALIRISLLWIYPIPFPGVQDEFSYLLAGDTFAHGRLTNPPHPMWVYFETMHVNQHPTYMSKYPPAQGAVLALGQLFGHPWIGVVLSVSVMCGAVVWALQAWLPPEWALLGGVLVLCRLGIFSYWMNSYWGGAVAAIGGALVIGALPRIRRFRRPAYAALLGLGTAVLANSRPFEGLIFCLPVYAALAIWLCGRRSPAWRETVPRIVAPIGVVLIFTALFIGYYNWRGTGHVFLSPYAVNSSAYTTGPDFLWQKARAPLHYRNPQFEDFYTAIRESAIEHRADSIPHAWRTLTVDASKYGNFYLWPELCVPLLALPWLLGDRRIRFLLVQFGICSAGFLLVDWFHPHYAAPLTATVFALLTQGIRHMRQWRLAGRNVGAGLTRAVVLCAILLAPLHTADVNLVPELESRARLLAQLEAIPGNHLVVVRYTSDHNDDAEWVYNRAEIDQSRVVWAREIPGVSLEPLLNYYRGRTVWLVEADNDAPALERYATGNR